MSRLSLAEKKTLVGIASLERAIGRGPLLTNKEEISGARKLEAKGLVTIEAAGGNLLRASTTWEGKEKARKVRREVNKAEAEERETTRKEAETKSKRRPCLVNLLTGEKTYGPAGMDEETLFEMMAEGIL